MTLECPPNQATSYALVNIVTRPSFKANAVASHSQRLAQYTHQSRFSSHIPLHRTIRKLVSAQVCSITFPSHFSSSLAYRSTHFGPSSPRAEGCAPTITSQANYLWSKSSGAKRGLRRIVGQRTLATVKTPGHSSRINEMICHLPTAACLSPHSEAMVTPL